MVMSGFYDLCVSGDVSTSSGKQQLVATLQKLRSLGYSYVAINQSVEQPSQEPATFSGKKKKGAKAEAKDPIPAPVELDVTAIPELKDMVVYKRITITLNDSTFVPKLNQSTNLKKYHIIAVIPTTEAAFSLACGTLDIDLISYCPIERNNIKLSRKMYKQAVRRGIHFELMYSPAIKDTDSRKNIIHIAHLYWTIGRSKNLIITSWADDPIYVRGPNDVINLSLIFGLKEHEGRDTIARTCRNLILNAEARQMGRACVQVEVSAPTSASSIASGPDHPVHQRNKRKILQTTDTSDACELAQQELTKKIKEL